MTISSIVMMYLSLYMIVDWFWQEIWSLKSTTKDCIIGDELSAYSINLDGHMEQNN